MKSDMRMLLIASGIGALVCFCIGGWAVWLAE